MLASVLATLCTLRVDRYPNAALHGKPSSTTAQSLEDVTLSGFAGKSAEISGQLEVSADSYYAFNCTFEGGQLVFVWIDDHLICQDGKVYTAVPVARTDLPLKRLSKAAP